MYKLMPTFISQPIFYYVVTSYLDLLNFTNKCKKVGRNTEKEGGWDGQKERKEEKKRKNLFTYFSSLKITVLLFYIIVFFPDQLMWQKQYIQEMTHLSKILRDNLTHISKITFIFPGFFFFLIWKQKTEYFGNWVTWIFA